jgi:transcriptional regulator with XRE-family HTH domain
VSKPTTVKRTLLSQAREEKGWTQAYVAEQVEVTVDAVRRWEAGSHLPYQITIHKLCNLFGMTPKALGLLEEHDTFQSLAGAELFVSAGQTDTHTIPDQPMLHAAFVAPLPLPEEMRAPTFPQHRSGTRESPEEEKRAAWEIHVELATRIATAALGPDEGILREALSSLHALFQVTRTILCSHSPAIAQGYTGDRKSVSSVAACMLNTTVRPFLAKWHPLLRAYEETRPDTVSVPQHEHQWERCTELRVEIWRVRQELTKYAQVFAQIAGAVSLISESQELRLP